MPNIPYTPPYAATGPWTNNAAPGISGAALNEIEGWIQQVDNSPAVTINGSTSGTASLYMPFTGFFKCVFVQLSNFRNGGGSAQTITLPVAFTNSFFGFTGQCTSFSLVKSGSTQTVQQITILSVGNDNSVSPQTVIKQNWLFQGGPGFDTISFTASYPAPGSGFILIFGN